MQPLNDFQNLQSVPSPQLFLPAPSNVEVAGTLTDESDVILTDESNVKLVAD